MKSLQEENKKLLEENKEYNNCKIEITILTREKTALETERNKSQTKISNYFSDCLDDNTTTSDKEENGGENQSQELFEPPNYKA